MSGNTICALRPTSYQDFSGRREAIGLGRIQPTSEVAVVFSVVLSSPEARDGS